MYKEINTEHSKPIEKINNCGKCSLIKKCLPSFITTEQLSLAEGLISQKIKVPRGDEIKPSDQGGHFLKIVQTGFLKSVISNKDGRDQVLDFLMPSDAVHLSKDLDHQYSFHIIALEDSVVCTVPFDKIADVAILDNDLSSHFYEVLNVEINRRNFSMFSLGSMKSEEKVAYFLLDLGTRFHHNGFSQLNLNFKMSRYDIASYLGLKHETVIRTLSKFIHEGLIELNHRELKILNLLGLQQLINNIH